MPQGLGVYLHVNYNAHKLCVPQVNFPALVATSVLVVPATQISRDTKMPSYETMLVSIPCNSGNMFCNCQTLSKAFHKAFLRGQPCMHWLIIHEQNLLTSLILEVLAIDSLVHRPSHPSVCRWQYYFKQQTLG